MSSGIKVTADGTHALAAVEPCKYLSDDGSVYFISEEGGWTRATDAGLRSEESRGMNLDIVTLTDFVKSTQPMAWRRFERMCTINPVRQFYKSFENAVTQDGLISVLRYGFKHRGINFRVCYFKPESELNDLAVENYKKNVCQCIRQWHYSEQNTNSIDMLLDAHFDDARMERIYPNAKKVTKAG